MKLAVFISALSISFLLQPHVAMAQVIENWELGISGITGRNFYNRKYFSQRELPSGRITDLKSNYLFGGGIWVEKYLNQHMTAMGEVRYTEVDVPTNFLCECSYTGSVILQDEKHYWGSLEVGLRYYLNPRSKVSFFVEGGAAGEWFIAAREKRNDGNHVYWNAMGYSRLAPSASMAFGAKWTRLTMSFGGYSNAARTMVRDAGVHDQVHYAMKTGILSRGVFAKASLTLLKLR